MDKIIKQFIAKIEKAEDGDVVAIISTKNPDREGDIVEPKGVVLDNFLKNPVVLWSHKRDILPVGKALWIKATASNIKAKIKWAGTQLAQDIKGLYEGGFLNAFSIGFMPTEYEELKDGGYRFTKWEMYEFSAVSVPANAEALAVRAKSLSPDTRKMLGVEAEEKTVIPYKKTPLAAEDAAWDASAEIKAADISDLKVMCAWYDAENADVKGAYKLPHHKAAGDHACVWRAVAAAMGALLGARGGVAIPDADRRGVYSHLAKHYSNFDKEPPEFKDYSPLELVDMHLDEKVWLPYKWLETLGGRKAVVPQRTLEMSGKTYAEALDEVLHSPMRGKELAQALKQTFQKVKG